MGTVTGSFPGTMAGYVFLTPPPAPREASASSLLSCKNSSCVPGLRRSVLSPHLRKKKNKTQVLGDYSAEGTQQGSARSHTVVPGWVSILMWTDHGETNCLLSLSLLLRRKIWVSETLGELSRLPQARAVWPLPVASKPALMGLDSLCPQRRAWKMSQGQTQSDCQAGKLEHCGSHLGCMSCKANVVEGHGKH